MKLLPTKIFHRAWKLLRSPYRLNQRLSKEFRSVSSAYQKQLRMNLRQWIIYHQKNIVFDKCTWMGVRALKNPLDAWIYQEIIYELKPDIIIEIGSKEGGSTLYLAHLLDIIRKGKVISIDIDRTNYHVKHDRIIALEGDSSSKKILDQVHTFCQNAQSILIIHDGSHQKKQVLEDLQNYSSLVSVGGYFIVEDSIVDLFSRREGVGKITEGPLLAIKEFLKENQNFVIDSDRERYIITYNPSGFLKRIS